MRATRHISSLLLALLLGACAARPVEVAPVPQVRLGNPRPLPSRALLSGRWDEDFGRDPWAPVGPSALLRDHDGFALLDQERLRILRFDAEGSPRGELPIPSRATLDAVSRESGFGLLAYDRLAPDGPSWYAQELGFDGVLRASAPLSAEFEAPSGIFSHEGALLIEDAHGPLCLADRSRCLPGRPDNAGYFVAAEKVDLFTVALTWYDSPESRSSLVHLLSDRRVSNVVALDPMSRSEGGALVHFTLLALLLYDEGPAPRFEMRNAEIRAIVVDSSGHILDELSLPIAADTDMARPLALAQGGVLLQLKTHADSLEVSRTDARTTRRVRP